jgi:hypothetical protein
MLLQESAPSMSSNTPVVEIENDEPEIVLQFDDDDDNVNENDEPRTTSVIDMHPTFLQYISGGCEFRALLLQLFQHHQMVIHVMNNHYIILVIIIRMVMKKHYIPYVLYYQNMIQIKNIQYMDLELNIVVLMIMTVLMIGV